MIQKDSCRLRFVESKVFSSQNVNRWSRCEFIRLRMQYGTEILQEIEYHSTETFQTLSHCEKVSFFVYLLNNCYRIGLLKILQQVYFCRYDNQKIVNSALHSVIPTIKYFVIADKIADVIFTQIYL